MQTLTLKAPAKINLYLVVLGKRADGFHNIETIFEKIDLCDTIILKKIKQGIKVICKHKDLPRDENNLGARAAKLLLAKANLKTGLQIKIVKKIPVASGLGGGSSDAASVLLGVNRLFGLGQNRRQLLAIATQLGADVPFFILPISRAIGRGKGEILTPLSIKKKSWYILVVPHFKVSTHRMYQDPRIALTKNPDSVKIVLRAFKQGNLTSLNKYSYNSFEPVLRKKYKQILQIKKALKSSGVKTTLVSGSGPCVFGIAQSRKEARNISEKLRAKDKNWQIIVAKTYQTKPRLTQ